MSSDSGLISSDAPAISVIVPVYNGAATLGRCLDALMRSAGVRFECIVVDDGSTDDSMRIAEEHSATVVRLGPRPSGPAHARNVGAAAARAPLLCFVDADVVVRADTLSRFLALFHADEELGAAFGSYDSAPEAPGVVSRYRNLLHHFVHQASREEASTFWAGCGAIRRAIFMDLGGFDTSYGRSSIEDIELGYRMSARGLRIRLDKEIQVTHLKAWTLRQVVVTDVRDRAIPWAILIHRSGRLPNDLNITRASRVSAGSLYLALLLLALGVRRRAAWLLLPIPVTIVVACNARLYGFFHANGGARFMLAAVSMHWLYYTYSTLAFVATRAWRVAAAPSTERGLPMRRRTE